MGKTARQDAPRRGVTAITAKSAVQAAIGYFHEVTGIDTRDVTVEEIELDDEAGRQYWMVTLGHPEPTAMGMIIPPGPKRLYKTFRVNATTGDVLSMKIREV